MAPSRNYTDLIAWQKSMNLTVSVYQATNVMPREEQFGLTSQMLAPQFPFHRILPKGRVGHRTPRF